MTLVKKVTSQNTKHMLNMLWVKGSQAHLHSAPIICHVPSKSSVTHLFLYTLA